MSATSSNTTPSPVDAGSQEKAVDKSKQKTRSLPPYHVVLLDDDDHSYEYVMEMLKAIFAYEEARSFSMAKEVDSKGRVIVYTTHRELAELKRDQIHAYGTDWRVATCVGSMSACIEPADG